MSKRRGEGTIKTSVPLNPLTDLLGNKTRGEEEKLLVLLKWLLIALSTEGVSFYHVDLLRRY